MPRARTSGPDRATRHRTSAGRSGPPAKVGITVRLDPIRARQLQAVADAENRTLTNYVETVLIRDLSLRDEASRVIMMHAAPETSKRIDAAEIVRASGESDADYARRQALLIELWSIPDSD
jgi:hypothetical protein